MSSQRLKYLYQKYLADQCTVSELKELKVLLRQSKNDDQLRQLLDQTWKDMDDREFSTIASDTSERVFERVMSSMQRRKTNYIWLKIAAVLILAGSVALMFYHRETKWIDSKVTAKISQQENKIVPGSNKAVLTLASGSNIVLNDIPIGKTVKHGNLQVSKAADGSVIYNFEQNGNTPPADVGMNTISTPRGGQYQIALADGSRVWLNASSTLKFPVAFTGAERHVQLSGEAYFEIAKNKAMPFTVDANGTTVKVLGTHFNINAYSDNAYVAATLLEGSVKFQKQQSSVMLVPGQEGIVSNNESHITTRVADMEKIMAWKNGYFIFRDESIVDIMKQVARWYDVDVEYRGDMGECEFGGRVSRYKDISELLNYMQLTKTIHYEIKGRKVIIMK